MTPKSAHEIEKMRRAGKVVGCLLKMIVHEIRPGVTTRELDRWAEGLIRKQGALPAFKGYHGFPATLCISVNEEVVHGIPGKRVLKEGDIIGVDVGAIVEGYYGDAARTFAVGQVDSVSQRLIHVAKEALCRGVSQAKPGHHLSDISHAVQTFVESEGFSVVRQYVGHGIGLALHEEPQVPNFGRPGNGMILKKGMTLAIEPMVNEGAWQVELASDKWTVVTKDGRRSSHFEDTILVDESPEVLTRDA